MVVSEGLLILESCLLRSVSRNSVLFSGFCGHDFPYLRVCYLIGVGMYHLRDSGVV